MTSQKTAVFVTRLQDLGEVVIAKSIKKRRFSEFPKFENEIPFPIITSYC